jgi:hypothetical protein
VGECLELFADTKIRENFAKQLIGANGSDNFTEGLMGKLTIFCNQFWASLIV